ncbi:uncharacterized protein EV420DRAFT_254840 [Desarmillaria tabescens]|uniref:Uncharacterized protein n=1 Tax=Armillaria tabescens TaxID=1929756 RepID=A0AA39KHP8_ARMTA|nr:uncharacterized protein EV420DRAFT_254840 [Desarmillaria tabescens]KAK0460181.1 hypothetical protein EV420DRAFT_254840 [Desarmillaria tabescens]
MFMEQKGYPLSSRLRLVITFLAASQFFTAICAIITCNQFQTAQAIRPKIKLFGENIQTQNYSYLGHDYLQEWNVPGPTDSEVYAYVANLKHYALDTETGISEWDRLLPPGGGMVHLGPTQRPFSVSMFHQLRYLNIIRGGLKDPKELLQHCMNYLQQMVLCRADSQLQSVRRSTGRHVTSWSQPRACRSWKIVECSA